jgi:hypothetical protein
MNSRILDLISRANLVMSLVSSAGANVSDKGSAHQTELKAREGNSCDLATLQYAVMHEATVFYNISLKAKAYEEDIPVESAALSRIHDQ